jgi:hypothetical protein
MDGLSGGLYQGLNALGTQCLADFLAIDKNRDTLQIGFELTRGGFLRPGSVPTKRGRFSTILTLCHCPKSFPVILGSSQVCFGQILPESRTIIPHSR